jgi:hypothetical protein
MTKIKEEFDMNNDNNMKSVIFGWIMLAGAYVIGRKHGRKDCISEVKDIVLKQFIDEKKVEKGS